MKYTAFVLPLIGIALLSFLSVRSIQRIAVDRTEIRCKRIVADWLEGDTEARVTAWRHLMNEHTDADTTRRIVDAQLTRLKAGGNETDASVMLRALPIWADSGDPGLHVHALCSLLDRDPDLPIQLRGELSQTQRDALASLLTDPTHQIGMRLRALAWLLSSTTSNQQVWPNPVAGIREAVVERLLRLDDQPRWIHMLIADARSQKVLTDWIDETVRFGPDGAHLLAAAAEPNVDLSRFLGAATGHFAFALRVPYDELEALCKRMDPLGFRPDVVTENLGEDRCHVIWHCDGRDWAIHEFTSVTEQDLPSIGDRVSAWRSKGMIAWDVALRRRENSVDLVVVTVEATEDSPESMFAETSICKNRVKQIIHLTGRPIHYRSFSFGEADWSLFRWSRRPLPGWRISYAEPRVYIRRFAESEPRQIYRLNCQVQPLPALRYGPERRKLIDLVLAKAPENNVAKRLLAHCQFREGDYKGAIETFESVEMSDSDFATLALAAAKAGRRELADESLSKIPQRGPSHNDVYAGAIVLAANGDVSQAIQVLDERVAEETEGGIYNIACAYSMLLDADGLTTEQRRHVIESATRILHQVIEEGTTSWSSILNDHDMRPLFREDSVRSRFAIRGGQFRTDVRGVRRFKPVMPPGFPSRNRFRHSSKQPPHS